MWQYMYVLQSQFDLPLTTSPKWYPNRRYIENSPLHTLYRNRFIAFDVGARRCHRRLRCHHRHIDECVQYSNVADKGCNFKIIKFVGIKMLYKQPPHMNSIHPIRLSYYLIMVKMIFIHILYKYLTEDKSRNQHL